MSIRASEGEVKAVIQTELTEEEVVPFLTTANVMVTDILNDEGYGDALLKQIEIYLAAHFVAIRDPQVKSETIGEVATSYHGQSGMGLNFTPYGQQVLLLDHHGVFARIQETKRQAEIKALG